MRSRSSTERAIGPATTRTASKPGFGSATARKRKEKASKKLAGQSVRNQGGRPTAQSNAQRRTDVAGIRHASLSWLEPEDAAVPGRDAYAPAGVRANAEHGAVRSEKRALASRGAACGVRRRPWVACAAPERVRALECSKRLSHVRFSDDDGARCAQRRDDLLVGDRNTDGNDRTGRWERKGNENVRRRRARLERSPTACIRSCCRNL
jgi:hypothetical protein